jgi:hypothetical protein
MRATATMNAGAMVLNDLRSDRSMVTMAATTTRPDEAMA